MAKNFISAVLEGGILLEEIENYVKEWHTLPDNRLTLQEFLGLDAYEYEKWLKEGNGILQDVIYCRRHHINLKDCC